MSDASDGTSRAEAAARRAELAAAHARGESAEAQRMIDDFVARASELGIPPTKLRAKLLDGTEVRTHQTGWYIKENRSVAIGEGGEYYVLVVAGGLLDRIRGVNVEASPPPLIVSRGGRDGETGDLKFFLERVLDRHSEL